MNILESKPNVSFRDTSAQDLHVNAAPPMSRRLIWLAVAALALAFGLLLIKPVLRWYSSEASVNAENVRFSTAELGTLRRDLVLQGVVVAADSPTLYAASAGVVRFAVKPGARVESGALLATVDSPELANRLAQEQASLLSLETGVSRARIANKKQALLTQRNLDQAQVALTAALREKARSDLGIAKGVISEVDFLRAKDNLETAELAQQHARKDQALELESLGFELTALEQVKERQALMVRDLERQVSALAVRSPVAGTVGNLAVPERSQVALNQVLLTVVDLTRLELEIGIPEASADDLQAGLPVRVEANGQKLDGTLTSISPQIVNGQALGRVQLADSAQAALKQNQRLSAQIMLGEKSNVLMIARGPAINEGGGALYVLNDGVAEKRRVSFGLSSLSHVEVVSGLKPGDRVIVAGSERFDGAARVMVNGL